MVGAILILLVILNSFCTGWLLSQVRGMRRVLAAQSDVMAAVAADKHMHVEAGVLSDV